MDGHSTDNTYSLIKKFRSSYIIKKQKKDKNLYQAINNCIKICKGKYILFLHCGDFFFSKNILKLIKKKIQLNNFNVLIGGCTFFKKGKTLRKWRIYDKEKISFFSSYKIPHTGLVISKNLVKLIGKYNLKYKIASDTDYILRLMQNKNLNIKICENFLLKMEYGGISTNYKNFLKKISEDLIIYFKYYKKYFLIIYFFKIVFKIRQLF
jgi:glycosyltransferase